MRLAVLTFLGIFISLSVSAQPAERRISREAYIALWKQDAQHQMMMYGIPASITLAQGILESANGNSALAKYANNHFGIKCHGWKGASFIADDDIKNECFRKYESATQSFEDHSAFLTGRSRYAFLFNLKANDYKGWAHGLKKAGYATNPKYAHLLIALIEQHNLDQYDVISSKVPSKKPQFVKQEDPIVIHVGRSIEFKDNGVRFILATNGDTFYKLAKEMNLTLPQLYKYNDLGSDAILHAGDIIYVQPKKGKSKTEQHTVKKGDTMWKISQVYGVKLKKLYKKTSLSKDAEPQIGDTINLR